MANSQTNNNKKLRKGIFLGTMAVLILGGGLFWMVSGDDSVGVFASYTVQQGPLTISVLESGTIKAKEQIIIKNEVEGRTSIIYLIEEGTRVKKGDLLVELDASSLLDQKIDQEISVQNAEAAFINATEKLAVAENQAESDKDAAELALDFAREDLKKYKEGEYPSQLKEAEAKIKLAEEELERAQDTFEWSQKLSEEKYISENELQADRLAVTRRELDLELTIGNRDLLRDFTYPRQIKQLESDIRQAEMALERTYRKANADVIQARAELNAKEAEYNRQKEKLQKIEDQIRKTKITAPADGLVIYATSAQRGGWRGNDEPLDEGQEVRERQELIYLPVGLSSIAEVTIHEASLKKVHAGLPAVVTVDALPGRRFLGTVDFIAPLPDPQSMWMNPDLKVYNSIVSLLEEDEALRTGMSCKVEIIVERYESATSVPVQAVLRVGGEPTVYVINGKKAEPRPVEIGLDNNRMIRIVSGLQEGEKVLLNPPLEAASIDMQASESSQSEQSETNQRIDDRLSEVRNRRQVSSDSSAAVAEPAGMPRQEAAGQGFGEGAFPAPSAEQMEEMRKRLENMTPEQREELRKRFENMTPEQREQMRQGRGGRQRGPRQEPSGEQR